MWPLGLSLPLAFLRNSLPFGFSDEPRGGGVSVLADSLMVLAGQVSSSTFFGDGYVNESSVVSCPWSVVEAAWL